jgi:hypothetical protein
MSEEHIPHSVLSDAFRDAIGSRRLVALVAVTFRFDPSFFETQVLPVFFDLPIARGEGPLQILQLEQTLRHVPDGVAVYYDVGGLETGEGGSARLDVRRIRCKRKNGIFHPKNILALVEDTPDSDTPLARSLVLGTMSANLTRSGWWSNVEVCHIERLVEGEPTRMRDDLLAFCDRLVRLGPPETDHGALRAIRAFIAGLDGKSTRRGDDGLMAPQFYAGDEPVVDFLKRASAGALKGLNLEVLSPYFDDHGLEPLRQMVRAFSPREVRVHLPGTGQPQPTPVVYDELLSMDGASWGTLPAAMLRRGKGEQAEPRFMHAKVYRFFQPQPKKEFLFVGSVNLTSPAHQGSANLESGIFVEVKPPRRPVFWLEVDETRRDTATATDLGPDEDSPIVSSPLAVRFLWDAHAAEVFWDDRDASPPLTLAAQGEVWTTVTAPARQWMRLPEEASRHLERLLVSTSFVTVDDGRGPVTILVDEIGMDRKPSVLRTMTVSDILKYWAQLTPEQKAEHLARHFADLDELPHLRELRQQLLQTQDSIFDRFAGTFHAFHCLERRIDEHLEAGDERKAGALFFGRQIDCLPFLLERVGRVAEPAPSTGVGDHAGMPGERDVIDSYLIVLCARQLLDRTKKRHPDFWSTCRADFRALQQTLAELDRFRVEIASRGGPEMEKFLPWFEGWFLWRAEPSAPADKVTA